MRIIDTKELKLVADRRGCVDALMSDRVFADRVLEGESIVNVITRERYNADVAISGEYILMVDDCSKLIGENTDVVDVSGKHIALAL